MRITRSTLTIILLFFFEAEVRLQTAGFQMLLIERGQNPVQSDDDVIRQRVKNFLAAWLMHRDRTETLAFIENDAYSRPAILGAACDGWYHRSDSRARAKEIVAGNLINSANTHAKDTPLVDILALRVLPTEMRPFAINPVDEDLFFLTRIDDVSLLKLFEPGGRNLYRDMIGQMIKESGPVYWAIILTTQADGDLFGVYTIWQQLTGQWRITSIDIVCQ